jgi:hypothetical protein
MQMEEALKRASSPNGKSRPQHAADLDEYLASVPADMRAALQKLRKAISAAAPRAEEGFSYGLPAFSSTEGRWSASRRPRSTAASIP